VRSFKHFIYLDLDPPRKTTSKPMKNKHLFLLPATIAAGFTLLSPNLHAAAITWDAGGVDNNWSTVDNWSDNAAATGDDITFNATGALASGITNTVDTSISIASLTYSQESATLQHTTAIAAGQTLTVAGNFLLAGSSTTAATPTNVTLTGSTGTLTVSGTSFQVGQTTPGASGAPTNSLDMSGLGTFNANLGNTGIFRLGATNSNTGGAQATVKLAATSSITADVLGVGDRAGRGVSQTLKLGSVANTINANTVAIGSSSGRGSGNLSFETSTGTLLLRAADGIAAVTTMNMVNNGFNHNGTHTAVVDFSAHSVDAKIGALTMARRTGTGSAGSNATLTFDTGTLEVASVNMAVATNASMTGANNATINIGGGTATFGAISMATNNGGGGTTAALNFTGGSITVTGDITRVGGTGAGAIVATLALSGASTVLDVSGKNLTGLTSITYTNGLLKNLGTVNTGMTLAGSGSRVFDQAAGISGQIQGAITGTGLGLTKQGEGSLTLSGTNTFTGGVTISTGELKITNASALGTGPKIINAQNLGYVSLDGTAGNISLASSLSFTTAGLSILNTAGDNVISGTVKTIAGNGSSTITSDGGSLTLAGNVDSGATGNRILELSGTSTGTNTVSGSISNGTATLAVTKSGAGNWTLTNATNSYTGATNINGGKLVVDGNISTSSLTTVASGATLAGSGTVGKTVINGTLAVGNSPGQMDFTDTLVLAGTTIMEIDGTLGAGVTGGHDFVNLTGAGAAGVLTYGGAMTLDIGVIFGTGTYSWNLFDMASETGTFATLSLGDQYSGSLMDADLNGIWDLTSGDNTWQFTESTGELGLTVIPEPSAALLGGVGVLALLRRRRSC
jgi:autotransporter-associated beta strand protein